MHILNLYNLAKNGEAARIIKERNHARVLDDTTLLDKNDPIIICMDTNSKDSRMLRRAINTGQWFDVAEIFSTSEPEATFCARKDWDKKEKGKGITRPDRVLINGAAKEMIRGYRLVKEAKFPGHIPIEIQFKNELEIATNFEMEKPKKIKNPKEWIDQVTEKEKKEILESILEENREEIDRERRENKVDQVWKRVSNCAERYIVKCMKAGGYEKNTTMSNRGGAAEVKKKNEKKERKEEKTKKVEGEK